MADVNIVGAIAEEIYKARNGRGCRAWGSLPNSHKEPYRLDARAALSALTANGFAVVSRELFLSYEVLAKSNPEDWLSKAEIHATIKAIYDRAMLAASQAQSPTPPTQTGEKP